MHWFMKQVNIFSEGSYLLCGNKKYQNKHINLKTIIDAEGDGKPREQMVLNT